MVRITALRRKALTILSCLALVLGLSACVTQPVQPELKRLYQTNQTDPRQPPVILIPGLMGSRLESESRGELWPGSLFDLIFSPYRHAALRIDPDTLLPLPGDTSAIRITGKFAGRNFYSSIIQTLETAGGFTLAEPGNIPESQDRLYYIFTYDWRLDNVQSARKLDEFIEQIRRDHGDPDMKFDLVAHSMGGLIARYYLRYGSVDVTMDNEFPINYHGENRIRRVVLLGTPNLGSVESLKAFIVGRKIGLRTIPPEVLITFPSFFQLFPHPLNNWLLNIDGAAVEADPFNLSTWQRFEWSIFNPELRRRIIQSHALEADGLAAVELLERYFHKHLERGRRFMWSLTVRMERTPWQLVVFGGACNLTPARMVVEDTGQDYLLHLTPGDISRPRPGINYEQLMLEPGDGVVTKASLLARESLDPFVPRHKWCHFPLHYPLFLCEEHSQLTTNLTFQDNLLNFLFNRD